MGRISQTLGADTGQILRFAIVGTATAAIYVAGYNLLRLADLVSPAIGAAIAYLAAISFQYVGHARFTFRKTAADIGQARRFLILNAAGLGFAMAITVALTSFIETPDWIASVTVVILLPILNWILMRLWVFA